MQSLIEHREAFEYWYSLNDRSCPEVAEKFGISKRTARRWNLEEEWEEEAENRDQKIFAKVEEKVIETIADMNLRHITSAIRVQDQILDTIDKLTPRSLSEAFSALETAVNIERVAKGEPSDIVDEVLNERTDLTDKELAEIGKILASLDDSA